MEKRIEKVESRVEDSEDQLFALRRLPQRVSELQENIEDLRNYVELHVVRRLNALTHEAQGSPGNYEPNKTSFSFTTWLGVVSAIAIPLALVILGTR